MMSPAPTVQSTVGPVGQLHMLGANELPLRQGFACGKTLVRR